MMRSAFTWLIAACLAAGAWYYFGQEIRTTAEELYHLAAPCASPVTYRIGRIDPSFKISTSTVVEDIESAADIWNLNTGKKLFAYDPEHGSVVINFEYDERQATTETLQNLGSQVDASESTYITTKAKYQTAYAQYLRDKAALMSAIDSYQGEQEQYGAEVRSWNQKGGAPKDAYARLEREKQSLQDEASRLRQQQADFNREVSAVNDLAGELNELIGQLNLSVARYNTVGAVSGGEFEQAIYERSPGRQTITVYEYENKLKLIRVLAHELGHALGLDHVDDPGAIMFELNESSSERLSPDDIAALKTLCRMK